MIQAAAVILSLIGAAFVAHRVKGKSGQLTPPPVTDSRKFEIQDQINRYLDGTIYPDFTNKMLHAKVGGAGGLPANSLTLKYILLIVSGWYRGYYTNPGDAFNPDVFDRVAGGQGGRWALSDYAVTDFTFPNIDKYTVDEGNDFGIRRDTGTWLENNFNVNCLVHAVGGAAASIATGGALSAPALISTVNTCRDS